MSFNSGFSTQGVPFVTGSDGQLLTWSDAAGTWVAGAGLSSVSTDVNTDGSITGSGSPSDPVRLKDDVTIAGNLTVQGTASITHLDTLYEQSLVVGDKFITILSGANNHLTADGSGFLWGSGSTDGTTGVQGSVANILYVSSSDSLVAYPNFEVFNDLNVGGAISGNASGLTNLPTSFDRIVYVSEAGNDANDGSFTNPLATISGALAYAKQNYLTSETVLIEVGPGTYSQNLTVDRYGTYIKSSAGRYEQKAVTVTGKTVINAVGTARSNHIVGIEGIFFNYSSVTEPTVNVSGAIQTTVYIKDCYLAANGSNTLKVQGITTSNGKVVLDKSYFLSQKGTVDNIRIEGGYVKADSIEVSYPNSVNAGTGSGIYVSGDATLVADRLLVEMPNIITGSSITANAATYISNASLSSSLSATNGAVYVGLGNAAFLYNIIFQNNFTVKGGSPSYVYYSDLVSPVGMPTFSTVTPLGMNARFGTVTANSYTALAGFTGSLNGTASYASDSAKLGGYLAANYANTLLVNNFRQDINVQALAGTPPNLNIYGGKLVIENGSVESTGSITVSNPYYFSGSGTGITGLSSSNWNGGNTGFTTDVRNQLNAGNNITYSNGTISLTNVSTGSNLTGSGIVSDPLRLQDNITLSTVTATRITASSGFSGSLIGNAQTATFATTAATASSFEGYTSDEFAKTGSNTFNGNQIINGTVNATSVTASFKGSLSGTASYALDADKLDGLQSTTFARKDTVNTFSNNQTITGSLYVSSQISSSGGFYGNGSNITNLTGSNWNGDEVGFYSDVRNAFTGDGVAILQNGDGTYKIQALASTSGLLSIGNITGSGIQNNEFNLKEDITVTTINATSITASIKGNVEGTASYALNSDKLDSYSSSDFAKLNSSNSFTGSIIATNSITANNGFTGSLSATRVNATSITGSLKGDGSQITNLTGSSWDGSVSGFKSDVTSQLSGTDPIIFDRATGVISFNGAGNIIYTDGVNVTGSGTYVDPIALKNNISVTSVTASFSGNLTGNSDTTTLAANSTKLNNQPSSYYARTGSNTFTANQTIQGTVSSSGGFYGNGSNITNLTGSSWANGSSGFAQDVRNQLTGSELINFNSLNGTITLSGIITGSNLTGSGTSVDPLTLTDDINVISVTASFFGDLEGTASNATNAETAQTASTLNSYLDTDFAKLNSSNEFIGDITASAFTGDGSNLNNISASNWSGGSSDFFQDVRDAFIAGDNITINSIGGGRYALSSSASGGGGGGLSTVETSGSVTGSGEALNPVRLKDGISVNYIDFNSGSFTDPGWKHGRVLNSGSLKYDTDISGLRINLGQQLVQKVVNKSGTTLTKGKVVHISGSTATDIPEVNVADWLNNNLSANTLGLTLDSIPPNSSSYVILQGVMEYDTHNLSNGAILYLSSSGNITAQQPSAPFHLVTLGQVIKVANEGYIYVSVNNGHELDQLHDVEITSKTNGDLLVWNDTSDVWENSRTLNGNYNFNTLTASQIYVNPSTINNMSVAYAAEAGAPIDASKYVKVTVQNTFQSGNIFNGSTANRFNTQITGTEDVRFTKDLYVEGTASIGLLNTINQQSLQIGDKYITILSGSSTHAQMNGAGILWGSGSTDGTTGDEQSVAYVLYRTGSSVNDKLEVFPGLNVSGSTTITGSISSSVGFVGDGSQLLNILTSSITNFSSSVRSLFSASNGISLVDGTGSLSGSGQMLALTASSHVSASNYYGSGENLEKIKAETISKTFTRSTVGVNGIQVNDIVAISGDGILIKADYSNDYQSNAWGVATKVDGNNYTITMFGEVEINGALTKNAGQPLYVGSSGSCVLYSEIPSGKYITQIGYKSFDDGLVILQPRVFGQKG